MENQNKKVSLKNEFKKVSLKNESQKVILKKSFIIIWGYVQYPYLDDRCEEVEMDYFCDDNGFSEDDINQVIALDVNEDWNALGSLYDIMVIRLK